MANDFQVTYEINGDESGLKKSLDRAKGAVQSFSQEFNRAISNPLAFAPLVISLRDAGRQFSQLSASGSGAMRAISISANNAAGDLLRLKKDLEGLKARFVQFTVAAAAAGVQASRGVNFESAFSDVKKVVEGSREELKQLENDLKGLSTRISVPLSGITQIAAQGGQLGLPTKDLAQFAELVSKISVGFNLLPEEAGNALGTLRNIFQLSLSELERFGDQINTVADNSNTSERDILNLITRVGDTAQQFGLLRSETLGLAAAILSLGKPPEIAATALENMLTSLRTANLQTDDFQNGLRALGVDAREFAESIDRNPKKALDDFLGRLKALDARSRAGIINRLFGKGQDAVVINQLISSLGEFNRISELASKQEIFSGSLTRTFEEREKTVSAAIQRMKNAFDVFSINASEIFLPTIRFAADALRDLAVALANVSRNSPNLSVFLRITALILPLAGAFRLLTVGISLVAPALGPAIAAMRGLIAAAAGGGVITNLATTLQGLAGVLSAAFGGVFGRLILGVGLLTGAFSGLTAAAGGFGATLFALATNPVVVFLAGVTAITLRIAGAGTLIARFGATLGIAGRALLAMVGGPIGAAVAALTFLGVKFLEVKDRQIEFAGVQTTVSEVISAAWRAIAGEFEKASAVVSQALFDIVDYLSQVTGINAQTWNAVKTRLDQAGRDFTKFAKDVVNGVVQGFVEMGHLVGAALGFMVETVRTHFDSAVKLAQAAAKDIKAAFSGDFGADNFSAAFDEAAKRNKAHIAQAKSDLKTAFAEIEKTDYVGGVVNGFKGAAQAIGKSVKEAIKTQIIAGHKAGSKALAQEQRKTGTGVAVNQNLLNPDKKNAAGLKNDFKQFAQADLQRIRDSIQQEQALLQAARDLDLQKAQANADAQLASEKDNASARIQIEADLAKEKLAIEERFNQRSTELKLSLLQSELSVRQQELVGTKDRGDQSAILADIARIEGEIATARKLSGIEAQKLALTEQKSAQDRVRALADLRAQLLQNTPIGDAEAQLREESQVFEAFKNGALRTQQEFIQALDAVRTRFQQNTQTFSTYADQAARNMQSSFADFLFDPFQNGVNGMLLNFVNAIKRMAAEALSAKLFEKLFGTFDKNGNRIGGLLSDAINAIDGKSSAGQSGGGSSPAPAPTELFGNFFSGIGDTFQSGLQSVLSGLSSAGGGIASFFSGFGSLISSGFSGLISGIGGAASSIGSSVAGFFAQLFGSAAGVGFATGGYVSGPGTGTSDSIPAQLSNGEYVVRAAAVKSLGVNFLNHINSLGRAPALPPSPLHKFAAGGLVTAAGGQPAAANPQNGGQVRIVNVVDPSMAKDWFESSAGEKVMINHITRNARQIKQVIG
jgi:TP901 family phage tail tape measure protein